MNIWDRTPNIPLLRKAVEWAEVEAARENGDWDQKHWIQVKHDDTGVACGTAYCIAGYVAQLVDPAYKDAGVAHGRHVSDVASEALGLTPDEDEALFHASNSIEDVRRVAEAIAGEAL